MINPAASRHYVLFFLFSLIFLGTSCRSHKFNYCVEGADDFVMDSYNIRQGKFSILEMEGVCFTELPENALQEYRDTISEDDILNILVSHPTRRDLMESIQYINGAVGFRVVNRRVEIPDIAPIIVEGLPLEQAREKIQKAFRESISDVEVFITYRERLTRKVELAGMVAIPEMPVDGKIRLFETLSRAKVPNNANFFKSYLSREGELLPIDFHKLMIEGDMSQNIVMRGGDKIFIADPSDSKVMIMGEVGLPRAVAVPSGSISLREAIVTAGGIPYTGDKNCIQIIRGGLICPKIYVLSWEHIIHLPNDSLLLIPGDTVYVSAKPITEWNRFISQLFPTFQGFQFSEGVYRSFIP